MQLQRTVRRNRMLAIGGLMVVLAALGILLEFGASNTSYIDLCSGRMKSQKTFAFISLSAVVEETPFSTLAAEYGFVEKSPAPDWHLDGRTEGLVLSKSIHCGKGYLAISDSICKSLALAQEQGLDIEAGRKYMARALELLRDQNFEEFEAMPEKILSPTADSSGGTSSLIPAKGLYK